MSESKTVRLCWGEQVPCGKEPTWRLAPVDQPHLVAYVCDEHLACGVRKLGVPAVLDLTASISEVEPAREPAVTRPAIAVK